MRALAHLDETLWSGRGLEPQDETTRSIAELNQRIAADPRLTVVQLTIRDGLTLIRRR